MATPFKPPAIPVGTVKLTDDFILKESLLDSNQPPIALNVGGTLICIGLNIIMKMSLLCRVLGRDDPKEFSENNLNCTNLMSSCPIYMDHNNCIFIDFNPEDFKLILTFLRRGEISEDILEKRMRFSEFKVLCDQLGVTVDPKRCCHCLAVYNEAFNDMNPCLRHIGVPVKSTNGGNSAFWSCCLKDFLMMDSHCVFKKVDGCFRGRHIDQENRNASVDGDYASPSIMGLLNDPKRATRYCKLGLTPIPELCRQCIYKGTSKPPILTTEPRPHDLRNELNDENKKVSSPQPILKQTSIEDASKSCLPACDPRSQEAPYSHSSHASCHDIHQVPPNVCPINGALKDMPQEYKKRIKKKADGKAGVEGQRNTLKQVWMDYQKQSPSYSNLHKTKFCPLARLDMCEFTSETCRFAHTFGELRHTEQLYKTQLCAFWQRGRCRAGASCRHAHGEGELRFMKSGTLDRNGSADTLSHNDSSNRSPDTPTAPLLNDGVDINENDLNADQSKFLVSKMAVDAVEGDNASDGILITRLGSFNYDDNDNWDDHFDRVHNDGRNLSS